MSVGENALNRLDKEDERLASLLIPSTLGLSSTLPISQIRHELCDDSDSEPSVRVWVVLDDSTAEFGRHKPLSREDNRVINDTIWQALVDADIRRVPLIYFRLRSEQATLDAGTALSLTQK